MTDLQGALRAGATIDAIAAALDALDHQERVRQTRALRPADQATLYRLAEGRHTNLDFFVPAGTPFGVEVVHEGINTLPVIGGPFQKRFARDPDDPGRLLGYNHNNSGIVSHLFFVTGPGYFVVRETGSTSPDGRTDHGGQLFINYYEQPAVAPVASWPHPKPPMAFTAGLVWGQMSDYMWRVSAHVSIGTAFKKGRPLQQYFVLVRSA